MYQLENIIAEKSSPSFENKLEKSSDRRRYTVTFVPGANSSTVATETQVAHSCFLEDLSHGQGHLTPARLSGVDS